MKEVHHLHLQLLPHDQMQTPHTSCCSHLAASALLIAAATALNFAVASSLLLTAALALHFAVASALCFEWPWLCILERSNIISKIK